MGGNTIEITLINLKNGMYRVLDSYNMRNNGGDLFTEIVVDILSEEFQKYNKQFLVVLICFVLFCFIRLVLFFPKENTNLIRKPINVLYSN
jgi:hypothetical protein